MNFETVFLIVLGVLLALAAGVVAIGLLFESRPSMLHDHDRLPQSTRKPENETRLP